MSEDEILDKYISDNYQWALKEKYIDMDELRKSVKDTIGFAIYNANFRFNECGKIIIDYLKTISN